MPRTDIGNGLLHSEPKSVGETAILLTGISASEHSFSSSSAFSVGSDVVYITALTLPVIIDFLTEEYPDRTSPVLHVVLIADSNGPATPRVIVELNLS